MDNPYEPPRLLADEEDLAPRPDRAGELRWLAFYSRLAIRIFIAQSPIAIAFGAMVAVYGAGPVPDEVGAWIMIPGAISGLAAGTIVFLLTRLTYSETWSLPLAALYGFFALSFPISFLVGILALSRAARRFKEFDIPFGWFGPDPEELETHLQRLPPEIIAVESTKFSR